MNDLVLISKFEIVECNFDSLKAELEKLINEKYNIAVTEDSVKEAKGVRAELNKGKKSLMDAWKLKKSELEAPIKQLDEKFKLLLKVCDEAMLKIDDQVSKFEAEKRALAQKVCEAYRDSLCAEKGLDSNNVPLVGFNQLTFITEKGSIASVAKSKIEVLVMQEFARVAEIQKREADAILERERIKKEVYQEVVEEVRATSQAPITQDERDLESLRKLNEELKKAEAPQGKSVYSVTAHFTVCTTSNQPQGVENHFKQLFEKVGLSKALVEIVVKEK